MFFFGTTTNHLFGFNHSFGQSINPIRKHRCRSRNRLVKTDGSTRPHLDLGIDFPERFDKVAQIYIEVYFSRTFVHGYSIIGFAPEKFKLATKRTDSAADIPGVACTDIVLGFGSALGNVDWNSNANFKTVPEAEGRFRTHLKRFCVE